VAIYTGAKALSRWPINDESTLTVIVANETTGQDEFNIRGNLIH
jgi:hypothetical protein